MGRRREAEVLRRVLLTLSLLVAPALAAALEISGEPLQGALLEGRTAPGSEVAVAGREVPVGPDGRFLIGLDRDAPERVEVRVTRPDGSRAREVIAVRQRDYDVQRIDGLPGNQVSPDAETLQRIRKDQARVRAARATRRPAMDFDSGWQWPVTGPISGVYGSQRILNGQPRQPHYGIDIAVPTGTPVEAPADGVVTLVAPDLFFSGGTLIVDHGHGLSSAFLHLSRILVEEGDAVRRGEVIAEVGATGRVTGAHLDWRMNWLDARIDPSLLVPPMDQAAE
ncbi:peptidase [Spiribacter halobius]|uniref:Peptidase n=1 Tax=Sediminicurvatus halobius TaxID=2182432 RepID=A0A2U2N5K9_9GAMM|nr:peptidase [Spiribacter halobius]